MTARFRTRRREVRAATVSRLVAHRRAVASCQWLACCRLVVCGLLFLTAAANAGVTAYHDRAAFTAALDRASVFTDDYESYPLGEIPLDGRRGDFLYSFDPTVLQPAVVPGGFGGQALGGSPFDVFVGGDAVTLAFAPADPAQATVLRAFGADFLYAPGFDAIPADTYRLGIVDGGAAGAFVGNEDLDPAGGSFFLGLIADPGTEFTRLSLFSVQPDPDFLVPAYQVDNLIYATVPEPSTLALLASCGLVLVAGARRRSCPRRDTPPEGRPSSPERRRR